MKPPALARGRGQVWCWLDGSTPWYAGQRICRQERAGCWEPAIQRAAAVLDGIDGGNTGVMLLHDGRIRGGDAFFDYIGAYSAANGRWKGEIVNREHTTSVGQRPLFGGHEVGIGFSGTYDHDSAEGEATALAGKRSIRFRAVMRYLVAA